ncbi:MAG: hypothetical protein ABJ157_07920 [Marinobacter sp.]|uniref:hypothetical protein n=1 Tax=Marinobacter sp. TaxID=50741 RepID=UPI003296C268
MDAFLRLDQRDLVASRLGLGAGEAATAVVSKNTKAVEKAAAAAEIEPIEAHTYQNRLGSENSTKAEPRPVSVQQSQSTYSNINLAARPWYSIPYIIVAMTSITLEAAISKGCGTSCDWNISWFKMIQGRLSW